MPNFVPPMECLYTDRLPEGPEWIYEVKLDGYRAQAVRTGATVQLLSKTGKNLGLRFPALLPALSKALPKESVVDGELVALDPEGRPSFSLIQNAGSNKAPLVFYGFDLLALGGEDLTRRPLSERRALLREHLKVSDAIQLSESFQIPAEQMLQLVHTHNLEGVVAKRLASCYEEGRRSGAWLKMRVELAQEFVIGGYTPGTHGFDAVQLGFYRNGQLRFCASVRNGFVPASRRSLFSRLKPLETDVCPFANLPESSPGRWGAGMTVARMSECVWLRPETVAQFRFLEWTPSEHLRHVSFIGLREDKEPLDVVKEGEEIPSKKPPTTAPTKPARRRATA